MIAKSDRRKNRLLALVLFFMTLALLVAAVAIPVLAANRHYDELIEGMNDQLRIYQRVARHSDQYQTCLLYTSPSPRDRYISRMPSSA